MYEMYSTESIAAAAATLGILGWNSVQDIRKHEICPVPTLAGMSAGIVFRLLVQKESLLLLLAALLPGAGLLALSLVLKNQIGTGDALCMLAAGAWNDADRTLGILCSAFLFAAVAAGILIMGKRRKEEMPFVPFLLAGAVLALLMG